MTYPKGSGRVSESIVALAGGSGAGSGWNGSDTGASGRRRRRRLRLPLRCAPVATIHESTRLATETHTAKDRRRDARAVARATNDIPRASRVRPAAEHVSLIFLYQ